MMKLILKIQRDLPLTQPDLSRSMNLLKVDLIILDLNPKKA